MKLTAKNYFTPANNYLSASKIKDFLYDKTYFYKKHITHEIIPGDKTPSLIIGSGVDAWLTKSLNNFNKQFTCVDRRNLKNPPVGYTEITNDQLKTIASIVLSVKDTEAYKQIKRLKFKSQVLLKQDDPNRRFAGLCGILDWLHISADGQIATIVDLKTTANLDKFRYLAEDYKYYLQLAFYEILVSFNFPKVQEIDSYILAVENDQELNRVQMFKLDEKRLDLEKKQIWSIYHKLDQMKLTDFLPDRTDFDNYEVL